MLESEKKDVVRYCNKIKGSPLHSCIGGNLSIYNKDKNLIAITPTGANFDQISHDDIVLINIEGEVVAGNRKPSIESKSHLTIYKNRSEITSIIHTHSSYSTTLSCLNIELPAFHYLSALLRGKISMTGYSTPGSDRLSRDLGDIIKTSDAVLASNHGLFVVGKTIKIAFRLAETLEYLSKLYYQCLCIGTPRVLSEEDVQEAKSLLHEYLMF